jgi:hypothetical protein
MNQESLNVQAIRKRKNEREKDEAIANLNRDPDKIGLPKYCNDEAGTGHYYQNWSDPVIGL